MLDRLRPKPVDNGFDGRRAALWLLGLLTLLILGLALSLIPARALNREKSQ